MSEDIKPINAIEPVSEEAVTAQPKVDQALIDLLPCAHCGSSEKARHSSNGKFLRLTHKEGCFHGKISVMKEGSIQHIAWQKRDF